MAVKLSLSLSRSLSLSLSRLGVFENSVLGRTINDEVTGKWRKLYKKELHILYCSSDIVRVIKLMTKWTGHVARMGIKDKCA
jgi:hypothetical protein